MEMHPECRFIEPAATYELLRCVESEDRRAVAMGPGHVHCIREAILAWAMAPGGGILLLDFSIIISTFKIICKFSEDCSC